MLFTLPNVSDADVYRKLPLGAPTNMCRTLIEVAALSFALPDSPSSLLFPLPLPAEEAFDGMLVGRLIAAAICGFGGVSCAIVSMARMGRDDATNLHFRLN
jgi:hypothetical protein